MRIVRNWMATSANVGFSSRDGGFRWSSVGMNGILGYLVLIKIARLASPGDDISPRALADKAIARRSSKDVALVTSLLPISRKRYSGSNFIAIR